MAKNGARGSGRVGAVKGREQTRDPVTGLWTKRPFVVERTTPVPVTPGFEGQRCSEANSTGTEHRHLFTLHRHDDRPDHRPRPHRWHVHFWWRHAHEGR